MGPKPTESNELPHRIRQQFSYRGERGDIWRILDHLIETEAYLNLGYSTWYQSHLLGSSQRRLARKIAAVITDFDSSDRKDRLLDIGCGRGGPAGELAKKYRGSIVGIDLVPYNVRRARALATDDAHDLAFIAGDASRLPITTGSVGCCTAIDTCVYLRDRQACFNELARVLEAGGHLVLTDLLAQGGLDPENRAAVDRFAEAWDMPVPGTIAEYRRDLESAGFQVESEEVLTRNSIGRLRKYTTAFGILHQGPFAGVIDRALTTQGIDAETVIAQIRRAHEALPHLEHVQVVAHLAE